jgi:succinate dehydrogenase / fumarate reductase flavoprotein subunit
MKKYAPEKLELAPRDVVSRSMIREIQEGKGFKHESGYDCLKLDLTHLGDEKIKEKLGGIREIGIKFSGIDVIDEPIEIRPVCHYMMGGIHTDIDGKTELGGLWAAGEAACNSTHGANRLGANSTSECIVWGRITGEQAAKFALDRKGSTIDMSNNQVLSEEKRIYDGIFRGRGEVNPYEVLVAGLKEIRELKASTWKHVDDRSKEYNTNFTNVMEIDAMLRTAEVVLMGAINRKESRGAHARLDYANRDDINYLKHTLAYYNSENEPKLEWHPVTFTRYAPVERKY